MWRQLARVAKNLGDLVTGDVSLYPKPQLLHEFRTKAELRRWQVFTDASFGGGTSAKFELSEDGKSAVFSGHYCSNPVPDDSQLVRYGYCGISTKVIRLGEVYDLDSYEALQYAIKGDGHTYIANLRVENFTGQATDVWQVPFRTMDNQWQELTIPFASFVPTKEGRLIKSRLHMARGKIISLGLALAPWELLHQARFGDQDASMTDDQPIQVKDQGPFRLEIASIVATGMARVDNQAN